MTPLDLWDGTLNDAKLLTLEILEQESYDHANLSRRIRISPSDPDDKISNGIKININNHFIIKESKSSEAVLTLETNMNDIRKYSYRIANNLLTKVIGNTKR